MFNPLGKADIIFLVTFVSMRKLLSITLFFFCSTQPSFCARGTTLLKGKVKNDSTDEFMSSVHVLNLSSVEGVITNTNGEFEIAVQAQDTLYFSYLGFKPLKVPVSNDMIKFGAPVFRLTQLSFALEEVILRPYQLTGYLDIDVRKVPLNPAGHIIFTGLPQSGYEAGNRNRSSISKAIGSLFNPADFLYNLFGKNPKQMRKLKKCGKTIKLRASSARNSIVKFWYNYLVLSASTWMKFYGIATTPTPLFNKPMTCKF